MQNGLLLTCDQSIRPSLVLGTASAGDSLASLELGICYINHYLMRNNYQKETTGKYVEQKNMILIVYRYAYKLKSVQTINKH